MALEKRRLPEYGGTPYGPGARLLAGAGPTLAQRVVRVVQQPVAAGAARCERRPQGWCLLSGPAPGTPHGRSHIRGARAAGERETGQSGAGPSWAGAGLGLGWRVGSGWLGLGSG
jgi:hypothetical protein